MLSPGDPGKFLEVTEEHLNFINELKMCLANSRVQEAIDLTANERNRDSLEKGIHEVLLLIRDHLTEKENKDNPELFKFCKSLIFKIASEFHPEETLLELLEEAEEADSFKFVIVTDGLKACLLRMSARRASSFAWVCNTFIRHLCEMELPKEFEENDSLFLREDSRQALDIKNVYGAITDFFLPFISEVKTENFMVPKKHIIEYKDVMLKCVLKILGRPMAYMDLSGDSPGAFRLIAEDLMSFISAFNVDPMKYFVFIDDKSSIHNSVSSLTVDADYTSLSIGVFYLLMFKYGLGINKMSNVYSIEFIFQKSLILCQDMLASREAPIQLKAVTLLLCILDRIVPRTIILSLLEPNVVSEFFETITFTMVYCESKIIRQKSVQIFEKLIHKFTSEGRFSIIISVKKSGDPGLIGYGLTLIKDFIDESLRTKQQDDLNHFTGKKLISLLRYFLTFEKKFDPVRLSDQIISSLNLIRYILIKDTNNMTGFSLYLDELIVNYLNPLKEAIENSKRDCLVEYDRLKKSQEMGTDRFVLTALGSPSNIPIPDLIKILDESMTNLDLIESLHTRVMHFVHVFNQNILKQNNN